MCVLSPEGIFLLRCVRYLSFIFTCSSLRLAFSFLIYFIGVIYGSFKHNLQRRVCFECALENGRNATGLKSAVYIQKHLCEMWGNRWHTHHRRYCFWGRQHLFTATKGCAVNRGQEKQPRSTAFKWMKIWRIVRREQKSAWNKNEKKNLVPGE